MCMHIYNTVLHAHSLHITHARAHTYMYMHMDRGTVTHAHPHLCIHLQEHTYCTKSHIVTYIDMDTQAFAYIHHTHRFDVPS